MSVPELQTAELRRKNLRLAWGLAGLALFFLVTSFPFWTGIFSIIGNQAAK